MHHSAYFWTFYSHDSYQQWLQQCWANPHSNVSLPSVIIDICCESITFSCPFHPWYYHSCQGNVSCCNLIPALISVQEFTNTRELTMRSVFKTISTHIVQSLTIVKVGHMTCTFACKSGTSQCQSKHCKPRSGRHLSRMAKPGLAGVWYYDRTTTFPSGIS